MFTSTWSKGLHLVALLVFAAYTPASAQIDSIFINPNKNAAPLTVNMDAVYNRPFLNLGKLPVSLGGYVEAHSSYFSTDGVTEGLSFVFPRLTVFMASSLKKRLKFLTEIEFEEGGREINIEFASLDVEFHPLLNLRGGIVMNPIGAFNQNHDGPKWEFVDRPIASTTIIPATWSNVGFGAFGKYATRQWVWAYEAYLTNGFNDRIIANSENRTWLPAAKADSERFEESFNGYPLVTLKTVIRHRKIAEIGLSWMGGVYNKFEDDGLMLDRRRRVDVLAVDVNTVLPGLRTALTGEWTWAFIDVPETYSLQFGRQQSGGFLDIVQPILRRPMLGWEKSTLNLALRIEYADYNISTFPETAGIVHDHVLALVPAISFRPSAQTVFRANYRYHWTRDLLGNPVQRTAGFQFGFSTYF
jgi:hypothetical protein